MKFESSSKTASFGMRPHIKKGYYPAKLLDVKAFKDANGKMKEGKWGHQLIFEFAIFEADPKTGAPVKPMTHVPNPEEPSTLATVVLPKFAYHMNRDKTTGELRTAITPKSRITKILKALGWTFSDAGVDTEKLIGNWIEANVNDYEYDYEDKKQTASTIQDVGLYKGPTPSAGLPDVSKPESKQVTKQIKHEEVKKEPATNKEKIEDYRGRIVELKKCKEEGLISEAGLKQALEQIEAKIKELE